MEYALSTQQKRDTRKGREGANARPVAQYDLEGKLLRVWPSTVKARQAVGGTPGDVPNAAMGITASARGFMWRYFSIVPDAKIEPCKSSGKRGRPTKDK